MRKFKDFLKKNESVANWQDVLFQACKDEGFFDVDDTPFKRIISKTFSDMKVKPSKKDVQEKLMEFMMNAIDESFSEDWNKKEENI